jgi:transposase
MLKLPPDLRVYLFTQATDMRCGFERLAALVQEQVQRSVIAGGVFVFLSRERRRVKLLWWDRDGYALYYKRLEAGVFKVERCDGHEEITGVDLDELLRGMDLARIKFRRAAEKGLYSAA